jgi:outer membrane protein assembly factor BamB
MRKSIAIVLVLIFLISNVMIQPVFVGTASGQTNSGLETSSSVLTPKLLWQKQFSFPPGTEYDGREWSSPTVVDGVVYVGATSVINCYPFYITPPPNHVCDWWSDFYAFNASNGAVIWDYRDHSALIQGSCVVADGFVFFSAGAGISYNDVNSVKALNAKNGALIWNYTANGEVSSPTVANGIVYVNNKSTLYALNATNGNKIWEASNYSGTLPIVNNGILYAGSMFNGPNANDEFIPSYALNALNASSGKVLWNYTTGFWVSTPAVFDSAVFFSADSNIYALNAVTGAKLWNYTTASAVSNSGFNVFNTESCSPTVTNGVVYVTSTREQNLIALKASNGVKLWNYTRAVGNPPTVANGVIYVDINGDLNALNAYNGYKIWDSSLSANDLNINPSKSPAVDENALYFSFGSDVFSAVELPKAVSQTSPPTIVHAFTDEGQTVNITINGNVTSSEISNVYLTTDQNTTSVYVYLTVTGPSHTTGFTNMTLPKSLIYNGTVPTIYIDNQKEENQGYVQDARNYYVWYTTNFSTHQISIIFGASQNSISSTLPVYVIWIGAGFAIIVISVVAVGLLVYFERHKQKKLDGFE